MLSIGELHGVMVVRMSGDVGEAEFAALSTELAGLLRTGHRRYMLNLDGVSHIRYTSLELLTASRTILRSMGADLCIACRSKYLRNILKFAGVDQSFRVHAQAAEAFLSLGPAKGARFMTAEVEPVNAPVYANAH